MGSILAFLIGVGIGVFCGLMIAALMLAGSNGEDDK